MNRELGSVLQAVHEHLGEECVRYTDMLTRATSLVNPLFFQPSYSKFFSGCCLTIPGWIPRVLMGCAASESRGAANLLAMWTQVNFNREAEDGILTHALDEARHARMFLRVLGLSTPASYSAEAIEKVSRSLTTIRKADQCKSEDQLPEDHLIDYMVQINITEIRTRIHLRLLAPVYYNMATNDVREEIAGLANRFEGDEVSHIAYTAKLINSWLAETHSTAISDLAVKRLAAYNTHTIEHTKIAAENFAQGRFPVMPE